MIQDKMKRNKFQALVKIQECSIARHQSLENPSCGSFNNASGDIKGGHNDGPTPSTAA